MLRVSFGPVPGKHGQDQLHQLSGRTVPGLHLCDLLLRLPCWKLLPCGCFGLHRMCQGEIRGGFGFFL